MKKITPLALALFLFLGASTALAHRPDCEKLIDLVRAVFVDVEVAAIKLYEDKTGKKATKAIKGEMYDRFEEAVEKGFRVMVVANCWSDNKKPGKKPGKK